LFVLQVLLFSADRTVTYVMQTSLVMAVLFYINNGYYNSPKYYYRMSCSWS